MQKRGGVHAIAIVVLALGSSCDPPVDPCDAFHLASRRSESEGMIGFFSPIRLPARSEIVDDACVEPLITLVAGEAWSVNGAALVDLGIFHIHEGIEHLGLGEACEERCGEGAAREAHVPLGTAACRDDVLGQAFPDTPEGRRARADALLGCAQAVVGYAVCLDGTATAADLGELWPEMAGTRCYNFGGPTGGHAGHAAMVQWIHMRDLCGAMSGDPGDHTTSWESGKVQIGSNAEAVTPGVEGDVPLCGTVADTTCESCGGRHERCCDPGIDTPAWSPDGPAATPCDPADALGCIEGRCWPDPPHWPPGGCGAIHACAACVEAEGCAWEHGSCVDVDHASAAARHHPDECDEPDMCHE